MRPAHPPLYHVLSLNHTTRKASWIGAVSLRGMLSDYWYALQQELLPGLVESELGPMGERYEVFVRRFWSWFG